MGGLYDRPFLLSETISSPPQPPAKPRAIVYIDGFNFYYGAVKGTSWKWLDFAELCRRLLKDDDIQAILYFTAKVTGTVKQARQMALWQALATLPKLTIIPGHFKRKSVECTHGSCNYIGDRHFPTFEEKHTDVNIAIRMLDDAYRDCCDRLILFSGDSDLVPVVRLIRKRFPDKRVIVYAPNGAKDHTGATIKDRRADELKQAANDGRDLPDKLLSLSLMPDVVIDAKGNKIKKPIGW